MRYTAYHFRLTDCPGELSTVDALDILTAELAEAGFDSFVPEGTTLDAFIPTDTEPSMNMERILSDLPIEGIAFDFQREELPDENWNATWERYYFKPIDILGRCYVRAPFHPAAPTSTEVELIISPKMAFGTGHHQTTSLILRELLRLSDIGRLSGSRVLDVGCGSGILGILAARLGAETVCGVDIDPCCVESTRENAEVNGVGTKLTVRLGNASELDGAMAYDLILANITLNINIESLPIFASMLTPGGMILCSGFFRRDAAKIERRAGELGLVVSLESEVSSTGDEWAMVALARGE